MEEIEAIELEFEQAPLKTGCLTKQAISNKINWKLRYFELYEDESSLYYYLRKVEKSLLSSGTFSTFSGAGTQNHSIFVF